MSRMLFSGIVAVGILVAGMSSMASAQAQRPVVYSPAGQSLYWITTPQMAKELEIVAEQKEQLDKIRNENQTKFQDLYKSLNDVPAADRGTKYMELTKTLGEETEKKIQAVLLPHQTKRLNQIMLQMKMQSIGYGYGGSLGGDDFGKVLALTDEQKETLKQKEAEVRKDIAEKTAEFQKKLQSDSREKILSVLTPAQRKALDEMIGQKFEWGNPWGAQAGGGLVVPLEKK